jgi:hypothetical protein
MKKILIISLGLVLILLSSFTILSKTSNYGLTDEQKPDQTDQQRQACVNQFNAKCLRGGSVDLGNFFSIEQVRSYCAPGATFCSSEECVTRLATILGLVNTTIVSNGDPCLRSIY